MHAYIRKVMGLSVWVYLFIEQAHACAVLLFSCSFCNFCNAQLVGSVCELSTRIRIIDRLSITDKNQGAFAIYSARCICQKLLDFFREIGRLPRALGCRPRALGRLLRALGPHPRGLGRLVRALGRRPGAPGSLPRALGRRPRALEDF